MSNITKIRRLETVMKMSNMNQPPNLSMSEKFIIIRAIDERKFKSRNFFEELEDEVILKTKKGLDVIQTYNQITDQMENRFSGWSGIIALIILNWFFIDCVVELGARRWIPRSIEKTYIDELSMNLYLKLRQQKWGIIRRKGWRTMVLYIQRIKTNQSTAQTVFMIACFVSLTYLKVTYPKKNIFSFEMSL